MRFKATWFLSLFFILLKLNHVESNFPRRLLLHFFNQKHYRLSFYSVFLRVLRSKIYRSYCGRHRLVGERLAMDGLHCYIAILTYKNTEYKN
jgi:hypothetical protein